MILGGAFFVNGNINPAAEANIFGDPEAADFVLGQPADNIRMVGLDVTHEVLLGTRSARGLGQTQLETPNNFTSTSWQASFRAVRICLRHAVSLSAFDTHRQLVAGAAR